MCAMTHSYVWQELFARVRWLIHACDVTQSYTCALMYSHVWRWLIHMWDIFIRVSIIASCAYAWHGLIHTCDMIHSHVGHDSFVRVMWLIHTCDNGSIICVTYSYVWLYRLVWCDSFIHMTMAHLYVWLIHTYLYRLFSTKEPLIIGLFCGK